MPSTKTPIAASQSLVSFSFNLPADIAKQLVARATKESENSGERRTPEQMAAIGVASLVECELEPGEFSQVDYDAQGRAFDANTPGAEVETINVNLLASDLDEIIANQEDLLHNDSGFRKLSGSALADAVEAMTSEDVLRIYGRRDLTAEEAAEWLNEFRDNAAQLRRLLAARGAN